MSRAVSGPAASGLAVALFALSALVPAPAPAQQETGDRASPLDAAAWLAGCWEAASPDGRSSTEEQWMEPRGGMMVGMSRSIRGGELRGYEFLTIRAADGTLVYHAEPSGQTPTDFPARTIEPDRLTFVNADHDFPRKIVYSRRDAERIGAAVYGGVEDAEPAFRIRLAATDCGGDRAGATDGGVTP